MNILMTTDAVGGVWTYSLTLCESLQSHGGNVCLAVKGELSADQRAQVAAVPNVSVFTRDLKLEWMDDPWEDVVAAGDWLLEMADACAADVIHLNDYAHGGLPWQAPVLMVGHSCVLSWYEAVWGHQPEPRWNRYETEVRQGLQAADLVVAPTSHMLETLDRLYGPLRRKRVIMNGCDSARFHSRSKQPYVFAAGRFWDEGKNMRSLAAAAAGIKWTVHVAGLAHPDGRQQDYPGVEWLGCLDRGATIDAFARATIYAHPALYEPFGLTVLEAALSRCALVLSNIPTLREIWRDAACYVSPHDEKHLSEAINFLIEDVPYREMLADRALRRGQELTAARMGHAYMAAYHHCMARDSKASSPGEAT